MYSTVKLLITCLFIAAANLAFAQQEGIITYENTIDLHRRLGPDQQQMKSMLPPSRKTKHQLAFNTSESLYKPIIDEEADLEASSGGMRLSFKMPYSEQYFNSAASRKVALIEFQGKDYLVSDSLKVSPWKFGAETKTILGYTCKQAYYTDDKNQEVVAWYTESLRPFLGPENYNTLPGTVLAVDFNAGERTILATKLDQKKPKKGDLTEPKKGQKMTRNDFQKMQTEQMEKMRSEGGRVIRVN